MCHPKNSGKSPKVGDTNVKPCVSDDGCNTAEDCSCGEDQNIKTVIYQSNSMIYPTNLLAQCSFWFQGAVTARACPGQFFRSCEDVKKANFSCKAVSNNIFSKNNTIHAQTVPTAFFMHGRLQLLPTVHLRQDGENDCLHGGLHKQKVP